MREMVELTEESALSIQSGNLYFVRNPETGQLVPMRCEAHEGDVGIFFFTNDDAPSSTAEIEDNLIQNYSDYFKHIRAAGAFGAKYTRKEFSDMMKSGQYRIA